MVKTFSVPSKTPQEFLGEVQAMMASRSLGDIASLSIESNSFILEFSKMGKSRIEFSISEAGSGFSATHSKEKIAFAHKPMRAMIEEKVEKVLQKCGAEIG